MPHPSIEGRARSAWRQVPETLHCLASVAGSAPKGPGLVIAVKENNTFQVNHCVIEVIDRLVIFCPVEVKENPVSIRIKNFTHLVRSWRVGRAAEGFTIPGTAELAFHADPGSGIYLRCLDHNGIMNPMIVC